MSQPEGSLRRKRRWLPRTWKGWLSVVAGFFIIVMIGAWMLSRLAPPWHRPLDPDDTAVIDNAERAQQLLAFELNNAIQRVPLGEQRWTISQDEINSLLAVRLAPPLNPNGDGTRVRPDGPPPAVSDPVVVFTSGKVTISARSPQIPGSDPRGGVGSVVFSVGIVHQPDGTPMGMVKLERIWVGDLPLPPSLAEGRIKRSVPQIVEGVERMIQTQLNTKDVAKALPYVDEVVHDVTEARPFPLQHKVDRKQIVIKELTVSDGAFTVVLAPPEPAAVLPRPAN